MIKGIGTDIVEIDRIEKAASREGFLERIFTISEIEHLKRKNLRPEFIAGRFAAKEAIVKALGTGFQGVGFKEIEVENNVLGKPLVVLRGNAKKIVSKEGDYVFHLSISHGRDSAVAYAIWEVIDKNENR